MTGATRRGPPTSWTGSPRHRSGAPSSIFGFPTLVNGQIVYSYVKTIDKPGDPVTVLNPNVGVQPVVAFEPLADPVLTAEGSESEGPSGFALSPPGFPAGLNHGVFIGFHGLFDQGGTANDENPLIFADPSTGHYFDFISNNLPNIGHLDEILSTADSLFVADISSTGELFGPSGVGAGMIYQIEAVAPPAAAASIGTHSLTATATQVVSGHGRPELDQEQGSGARHQHRPQACEQPHP